MKKSLLLLLLPFLCGCSEKEEPIGGPVIGPTYLIARYVEGDAAQILPTLTETYDFIFMDAAKGQYIHFMPDILRLLGSEGTLVSDNVLQDGDIIESRFAVTRRNRTIHKRMREYLYELTHDEHLVTAVLPIGDGVTVSTWKK